MYSVTLSVFIHGDFFFCVTLCPARAMHSPIKLSGRESISWNFGAAFNELYCQDQQMKKGRAEVTHHLGSATNTVAATQSNTRCLAKESRHVRRLGSRAL